MKLFPLTNPIIIRTHLSRNRGAFLSGDLGALLSRDTPALLLRHIPALLSRYVATLLLGNVPADRSLGSSVVSSGGGRRAVPAGGSTGSSAVGWLGGLTDPLEPGLALLLLDCGALLLVDSLTLLLVHRPALVLILGLTDLLIACLHHLSKSQ